MVAVIVIGMRSRELCFAGAAGGGGGDSGGVDVHPSRHKKERFFFNP